MSRTTRRTSDHDDMNTQDNILNTGVSSHIRDYATEAPTENVTAFTRNATELFQAIDDYDTKAAMARSAIQNDKTLSQLGREEKLTAALTPLQGDLKQRLKQRTEAFTQGVAEQEQRHTVVPPPLDADPAVSEARLANARSDARMMLDAAGDRAPDMMRQLVEANTDPAVTHLLMHTNWPALYLHNRSGATTIWKIHRDELMPTVLPEQADQIRAGRAVTHLKKAAELIKASAHFALADRGIK